MVLVNPFLRFTTDFFTKIPGFKGKGSWTTSDLSSTSKKPWKITFEAKNRLTRCLGKGPGRTKDTTIRRSRNDKNREAANPCLYQRIAKGAGKKVPREKCRKVSKNFLTLFDDFWHFLPCVKIVEKCRKTFWHFLTIFDIFWRGPFPPAPLNLQSADSKRVPEVHGKRGLAEKGWQKRFAERVGEGLAKGWQISLHPPTSKFPRRPFREHWFVTPWKNSLRQ